MADKHDLEIIITSEGEIKMEVKGMKGPACLTKLKAITEKLGEMKSQDLHPEYYEQRPTNERKQTRS